MFWPRHPDFLFLPLALALLGWLARRTRWSQYRNAIFAVILAVAGTAQIALWSQSRATYAGRFFLRWGAPSLETLIEHAPEPWVVTDFAFYRSLPRWVGKGTLEIIEAPRFVPWLAHVSLGEDRVVDRGRGSRLSNADLAGVWRDGGVELAALYEGAIVLIDRTVSRSAPKVLIGAPAGMLLTGAARARNEGWVDDAR